LQLQRVSIPLDGPLQFEMNGYASNSKYTQLRQMVFVLFINERLVDCLPIRKAVQAVYSLYMPKSTNFFVYLNLAMSAANLDVNIHPTKHEVTDCNFDIFAAEVFNYLEFIKQNMIVII
jgi:DNA mismatch repair protein MLH1